MSATASADIFIPSGPYCYQLLEVVNRPGQFPLLRTRSCSHFQTGGETTRCNLLNIQDDILLSDCCKICGINDDGCE